MSYEKHTWVTNEIIRGKNLNHIEDGIYNEEHRALAAEQELSGQMAINTSAIQTLNANASTPGSVDYKIAQATTEAGGYKVVVDHTLVEDPSDKYIYLEPDNTVTGSDKFREWIYVDGAWKMTGDVSLDLSDYIQKTDYATSANFGVVKVDGTTITSNDGVISSAATGGVTSFNGRTGAVTPQSGDYTASDVGLGNVGNFKAVSTVASQGLTSTEQENARNNIGAGTSNFDGAYSSLSGTPTLGSAASLDVASSGDASTSEVVKGDDSRLTDARTPVSHTHTTSQITDFPTLGTASALDVATSGNAGTNEVVKGDDTRLSDSRTPTAHTHTTSDITNFPTLATVATSGSYNDLSNTPTIPTATSDLTNDSGFIDYKAVSTVANQGLSDTEKANARSNIGAGSSSFSGNYNDLSNKPTLGSSSALDVASSGDASSTEVVKGDDSRLTDSRTPTSHTHTTSDITNLPTFGTAASLDVAVSGDASTTEVVKGDDSRLTDARTPVSHTHTSSQITDFPTLGSAAGLDVPTSGDASSSEVVKGDDSRLSDSRTPVSHTHTVSDITNLPTIPGGVKEGTSRAGASDTTLYFVYTT